MKQRWDIFCTIVDNFGDVGLCWRLARQLVKEYGLEVRLWVDDISTFACIAQNIDLDAEQQWLQGVKVCSWRQQQLFVRIKPADVVIEAFACELPSLYIVAMAALPRQPIWLNLEYLSAENWVIGCHLVPSFHPRLPLTKYFFFPGFVPGTGGLILEKHLLPARSVFNSEAQVGFWQRHGMQPRSTGELRISLFCYDSAPIQELLSAWVISDIPVYVLVPQGLVADTVTVFFDVDTPKVGEILQSGKLKVCIIPFLEQDEYDKLLWACDVNFVRGEDSFVRAQWAARPFVWNIYPQTEESHQIKLNAFLNLYTAGMSPDMSAAVFSLWNVWNGRGQILNAWSAFATQLVALNQYGEKWVRQIRATGDLVSNLVQFSRKDQI